VLVPPVSELDRYEDFLKNSDVKGVLSVSLFFRSKIPSVIVDHEYSDSFDDADSVNTDNFEGGKLMMRQVISAGHKKIAIYSSFRLALLRQHRVNGFLEEMRNVGFRNPEKRVYYGTRWSVDEAVENLRQMKKDIRGLSIIVCDSDDAVSVMLDAARILKLDIPGSIAITGFGNVIGNYGGIIRIANIEQFPVRLGAIACDRLIEKIESAVPLPPKHQFCQPVLVNPEAIPPVTP
jgi:DNA-binding LacI/PurR family transcriptional regulator